jgi:hypothetical protein
MVDITKSLPKRCFKTSIVRRNYHAMPLQSFHKHRAYILDLATISSPSLADDSLFIGTVSNDGRHSLCCDAEMTLMALNGHEDDADRCLLCGGQSGRASDLGRLPKMTHSGVGPERIPTRTGGESHSARESRRLPALEPHPISEWLRSATSEFGGKADIAPRRTNVA